jgi:hypothetical protein
MDRHILVLALETLEKQRMEVERAIAEIREMQGGNKRVSTVDAESPALVVVKRRSRTQAERRAQAKRMREYWAKRRAQAGKARTEKSTPSANPKRRAKTDAEKRALSLKMREIWKTRKSQAGKNAKAKSKTANPPKQPK